MSTASCGVGEPRWVSEQVEALAAAWERGERSALDHLLASNRSLDGEAAIRLIYEDACLRRDAGEEVHTVEVAGRYPQWQEELSLLLGCDRVLRPLMTAAEFPAVGTALGPFHLLAELGRGASGRTYLATEAALDDRPVVLKVIPDDLEEHLRLARLQHTHIVPLYSEQSFPERGLRALCMPYLGGASLAQVLGALGGVPVERRRGRDLIEALEQAQVRHAVTALTVGSGPCRRYLEGASYTDALCWVGSCLADALQYAHARGLFHMDLTPANVLIAADGQPMLLDFHLARAPIAAGEWVCGRLGGTPNWMSPEQAAALDAVRAGRPVPAAVDGRSDIHALGRLLHHTLGAGAPEGDAARSARRFHHARRPPGLSVGLSDILEKCLAPEPYRRYQDAAALGEDLRRHLSDLPLRGAPNRSPIERWRKCCRRHGSPVRAATRFTTLLALTAAAVLAGAVYVQRVHEIGASLEDGRRSRVEHRYPEAVQILERGLEHAAAIPGADHLGRAVAAELNLARRGQDAAALHRMADLIRFRHGLAPPEREEALVVARHCREIWGARHRLVGPGRSPLDDVTERQIKTDLLELAIVGAELNVQLASPAGVDAARLASLHLLDQAELAFGPSASLDRQRTALAPRSARKPSRTPTTAWEHYDLGRSYLRSGQLEEAAREFRRALDLRPQDFWPNFYQGLCAFRTGNHGEACAAFRTCIALAPDAAECYYNLALASLAAGDRPRALACCEKALDLGCSEARALCERLRGGS
jgi:serine/threonine protein kinase